MALVSSVSRLLHAGRVYDLVQALFGERIFRQHLVPHLTALPRHGRLIDIGGGTGQLGTYSSARSYICLDADSQKLDWFRRRGGGLAVAADGTACPLQDASVDAVLCSKVAHHLSDAQLRAMLVEAIRILKPGGVLILADPVQSARWIPRLMWRLDRGSFPRTARQIRRALPDDLRIASWDEFRIAIFHDIVLCVAQRQSRREGNTYQVPLQPRVERYG